MDVGGRPARGVLAPTEAGFLTLFEALNPGHIEVGTHYKSPGRPIWVVCSESHYSVMFCKDPAAAVPPPGTEAAIDGFDVCYYDELGRQDAPVTLTLRRQADGGAAAAEMAAEAVADPNGRPPLEHVLRTRWPGAAVDWNGAEPIL